MCSALISRCHVAKCELFISFKSTSIECILQRQQRQQQPEVVAMTADVCMQCKVLTEYTGLQILHDLSRQLPHRQYSVSLPFLLWRTLQTHTHTQTPPITFFSFRHILTQQFFFSSFLPFYRKRFRHCHCCHAAGIVVHAHQMLLGDTAHKCAASRM